MTYLTAQLRLKVGNHDAALLSTALSRWHAAFSMAMDMARSRQNHLRHFVIRWTSADGTKTKWVVDGATVHKAVLEYVYATPYRKHLHSSATMSLVVAVEEQVKSWLGLLADWANGGFKLPKPQFPTVAPGSPKLALAAWEEALDASIQVTTLAEEDAWRAEVTRAAKARLLPQYFGACQAGGEGGQAHCGLLKRADGRLFALLTLWPLGDRHGEPVARARNRSHVGPLRNVRAVNEFNPTERSRSSVLVPIEMGRGHEQLFLKRAVPKSAELIRKDDGFFLNVAFEFPDHPARDLTGGVLAVRRGISTLASWVLVGGDGQTIGRGKIDGRDLKRLLAAIYANRATKQAKGLVLAGDRRAARVAEHHLYSAGHQLIDVACRAGAEIVLLEDPGARRPQRLLRWKHFARLADILTQLAAEAGLPEPRLRPLYGSWRICLACGWQPGETVRVEHPVEGSCGACGLARDEECHLASALCQDALRLRLPAEIRPTLAGFIRGDGKQ